MKNMKSLIPLIPMLAAVGCAQSQDVQLPRWTITVLVTDKQYLPVTNANVKIAWHVPPPPDQNIAMTNVSGITDSNGVFRLSQRSGSIEVLSGAEKTGYYPAGRTHEFQMFGDDDPAKWNPTINLLLKQIVNPIAMYAKRVETKVQRENESVGFDLMAGDWVAPFGLGSTTDLLFAVRRKVTNAREYEAELKLTFPNRGDGIAVAPPEPDGGSVLKTSRTAAESGYEPERVWPYSHKEQPESVFGYFFRVRTVLDGQGNVVSAHYGKIRGDFRFYVGTRAPSAGMGFDYYLNPTTNDRNLEFDPKQNLLTGLKPTERIREP